MKLLALDSSSIVATVAVVDEDKIIGEMIINHKKNHSKKLMPLLRQLLDEVEIQIKDVDAFGVSIGPGSFTGIRIGLAAIKALAQIENKPLIGVSTLEGLAFNLPNSKGIICPILDAQREEIYTGLYKWEDNQMFSLVDDQAISAMEWIDLLKNRPESIQLVGDGIEKFGPLFKDHLGEKVSIAPVISRMPRASSIGSLALGKLLRGEKGDYKSIVPHYIRKSQAEQKFGL